MITGGAGLLGKKHAEAVIEGKGIPVLIDISAQALNTAKKQLIDTYGENCSVECYTADITTSTASYHYNFIFYIKLFN